MSGPSPSCPRCRQPLEQLAADVGVYGCARCAGGWLDNRACHSLLQAQMPPELRATYPFEARAEEQSEAGGSSDGPYRNARKPPARCPVCDGSLAPSEHLGVELDVCAAHGTWFDRGELRRLVQRIAFDSAEEAGRAEGRRLQHLEVADRVIGNPGVLRHHLPGPHGHLDQDPWRQAGLVKREDPETGAVEVDLDDYDVGTPGS